MLSPSRCGAGSGGPSSSVPGRGRCGRSGVSSTNGVFGSRCWFNVVMVVWHLPRLRPPEQSEHPHLAHARELLRRGHPLLAADHPLVPDQAELTAVGKIGALVVTDVVMFVLAMALSIFSSSVVVLRVQPRPRRVALTVRRPTDRGRDPVDLRGFLGAPSPHLGDPPGGRGGGLGQCTR